MIGDRRAHESAGTPAACAVATGPAPGSRPLSASCSRSWRAATFAELSSASRAPRRAQRPRGARPGAATGRTPSRTGTGGHRRRPGGRIPPVPAEVLGIGLKRISTPPHVARAEAVRGPVRDPVRPPRASGIRRPRRRPALRAGRARARAAWLGGVVRILDRADVFRPAPPLAPVERARDTDVPRQRDHSHPQVYPSRPARDPGRCRRSRRDDDQLDVAQGLREHRLDRALTASARCCRADDGRDPGRNGRAAG